MRQYAEIRTADDVTEEVTQIALDIADGWYQTGRIDWDDLIDRIEGSELDDGSVIDFGDGLDKDKTNMSGAIRKLKALIRQHRRES